VAALANAHAFLAIQREFGTFDRYLWVFVGGRPLLNAPRSLQDLPAETALSRALSKDLIRRGFRLSGSGLETVLRRSAQARSQAESTIMINARALIHCSHL
jgi:3-methyladenine DNA glycosylase Tag